MDVTEARELMRKGEVKFKYTKKDGTMREARGTLNMDIIPEKDHPKGNSYELRTNLLIYFDLDKEAWRSCWEKNFIDVIE